MRAFVVGNGPSLMPEQLDKLHKNNDISFGVNRIHLIYGQTKWRPTHWVIMDFSNSLFYKEDIDFHSRQGYACHLRSDICAKHAEWCLRRGDFPFTDNFNIVGSCDHIDIQRSPSDGWHEPVCQMGGSVPTAIQLAVHMGYNPIYLIGCDGNLKGSARNHFSTDYVHIDAMTVGQAILANKTLELAHTIAGRECKERGVTIFNATVGGTGIGGINLCDFNTLFN